MVRGRWLFSGVCQYYFASDYANIVVNTNTSIVVGNPR
jgi:hypothetical protein